MKTETKPGTVISLQDIGGGRTSHGYKCAFLYLSAHMECKLTSEEARKVFNILFLIRNMAVWNNSKDGKWSTVQELLSDVSIDISSPDWPQNHC